MSVLKYIQRIKHIDHLLRTKSSANLKTLCRKLNLSRSTVIEFLKEMKALGFPIKYDRKTHLYFYYEEGRMIDKLFIKKINKK